MKGFVPTPNPIVDMMVNKLFAKRNPRKKDLVLDPGCGTGAFISGIVRFCQLKSIEIPRIIGIESDPRHIHEARNKFDNFPSIEIKQSDFLLSSPKVKYDFIIGNPPYIPITKLTQEEKEKYRALFRVAKGRFDLYILFFEQALMSLKLNSQLVFITPEKYLYVDSALKLRELLGYFQIQEIHMIHEQSFGDLATYPTITTLNKRHPINPTTVILRNGITRHVTLPVNGSSFLPVMHENPLDVNGGLTLNDIVRRVSCGVATGADAVFIRKKAKISSKFKHLSYPTISGRQLTKSCDLPPIEDNMIIPYSHDGKLLSENSLGSLIDYLKEPSNYSKLNQRSCVKRKKWYAFHENPPLCDILNPKILCKDITKIPYFWIDYSGTIVPRHSVYYIVPYDPTGIDSLCQYLNSDDVRKWLESNCQRAANGFLRLQSNVLRKIPISKELNDALVSVNSDSDCRIIKRKIATTCSV